MTRSYRQTYPGYAEDLYCRSDRRSRFNRWGRRGKKIILNQMTYSKAYDAVDWNKFTNYDNEFKVMLSWVWRNA